MIFIVAAVIACEMFATFRPPLAAEGCHARFAIAQASLEKAPNIDGVYLLARLQ
jgi:hypothetical protein